MLPDKIEHCIVFMNYWDVSGVFWSFSKCKIKIPHLPADPSNISDSPHRQLIDRVTVPPAPPLCTNHHIVVGAMVVGARQTSQCSNTRIAATHESGSEMVQHFHMIG